MDPNANGSSSDGETNNVKTLNHHTGEEKPHQNHHHHTGDGASPGKIFIGGLAKETTPLQFTKYFGKYGEITDSVIMKDRVSGQARGFGFVTYSDASVVDRVIEDTHVINGKQVEIKRTIPKGTMGSKDLKTKKIFVGGIPTSINEDEFSGFFSKFGEVKEHQIMRDHASTRSRGFGFITFDSEESVDNILSQGNKIEFAGAQVEIKKAEPKKSNPPLAPPRRFSNSRPSTYGGAGAGAGAFGDAYDGYGAGGGGSYRSGGLYGGRPGGYAGYGTSEFGGGYGFGGSGLGDYRESSLGYAGRYGGGFNRGYDLGGGYGGGAGEGYGGYSGGAGGYGSSYDAGFTSGYRGSGGSSLYGNRGGYGGSGGGRYHPYAR
ncbi:hypothetical protein MKW92_028800 [Papaver armeniacum]|nr:hypothetical protein MKW92_028800 [Papaver armeniacum]